MVSRVTWVGTHDVRRTRGEYNLTLYFGLRRGSSSMRRLIKTMWGKKANGVASRWSSMLSNLSSRGGSKRCWHNLTHSTMTSSELLMVASERRSTTSRNALLARLSQALRTSTDSFE